MYEVAGQKFNSFLAAIRAAQPIRADVIEVATGLRRWTPAPKAAAKARHVIVNADGSTREFSKVAR